MATLDDLLHVMQRIDNRLAAQAAIALNANDAADLIGVSPRTVARLAEAGKLKACKVSEGRWVYLRSDLLTYLESAKIDVVLSSPPFSSEGGAA